MQKSNSNRATGEHLFTFFGERFSECAQANILTKAKTFITTIKNAPWLILGRMPTVKTDAVAYLPAEGFGEKILGGMFSEKVLPQKLRFIKTLSL